MTSRLDNALEDKELNNKQVTWLFNTLLCLRDDLVCSGELTISSCPEPDTLERWVQSSYYPGLNDLAWHSSMTHLLTRIRVQQKNSNTFNARFIWLALQRLNKLSGTTQPH